MLDHLLVVLLAPLLRRLIELLFKLSAFALAVTIPARLWVRLVESHPSERTLAVFNAVTAGMLSLFVACRCLRRRH